ncbi:MAG TPA: DNA-directed RNA polymerase subunit alpha [Phycisphaerae bacterium]|mgnify:CR=1 FL=1|nr:DNA-directed RNA polymerase subunit alpha [Phycisphaerae bacterium]HOJ74057.1 DNA-directed RNA polymerase subunit alpha [Phycisphaerae bacterium]HOM50652.1 DNA-directed RNA polymerase subunit alpha [Phycisphaerae bacterium]HOQ87176.1 DNA-directed RNA polymerase subunit alpha [Phycisphaerae bacterium]HPP26164.1 DNA-directed RNA polymerase subunit alpha [Phycisphaerae bacterium]
MRVRWRGLELPTQVIRDEAISTDTYARLLIEPFERGFGTTVGNSLRRILLSSLEGAAVTKVRIAGASHEFMSLPGVQEDVADIILNIKSLVIKLDGDGERMMRLVRRGPGEVYARDIVTDPSIQIINQGQLLATLTEPVELSIEFWVAPGRGYHTADENRSPNDELGIIAVDSVFSPVTRVRYKTEETRVGQRTNYDRLILEIWTKGTVRPEDALVEAAKILRKHLNPFVQYRELGQETVTSEATALEPMGEGRVDRELQERLSMPISQLDLSVRASNCLESAKVSTVGELVRMTESDLLKVRSFGRTSLREVKRKLADLGLTLGMSFTESGAVIPPEHPPTVEDENVGEVSQNVGPEGGDNPTMPASLNNY